MRILLAGATGAIGRQLVPLLVARGHHVVGTTRTPAKAASIRQQGAEPVVLDLLDTHAVAAVVAEHRPDVIIHQATALSGGDMNMKHFDRYFAETNRLRTEGIDHLLAAGHAIGIKRFVAQSFAGWPLERSGNQIKAEDAPLDPEPMPAMRESFGAIRYLEETVAGADWTEGVVLRYGGFYGPGTSFDARGGEHVDAIRKRQFPIVGNGRGIWSFIHIADAAEATAIAAERAPRGVYHVVDDKPSPVTDWLPVVAEALGAKRPLRVPRLVGRVLAGEAAVMMMTEGRGASNAKAKRELGWTPRHRSIQETVAAWAA